MCLSVSLSNILFVYSWISSVCHSRPSWPLNIKRRGLKFAKIQARWQYFQELCKNPFPSAFQIYYEKNLWRTRIKLLTPSKLRIKDYNKAVYTPLNEIEIMITKVPRKAMNRLYCICMNFWWDLRRGVFNAKIVQKDFGSQEFRLVPRPQLLRQQAIACCKVAWRLLASCPNSKFYTKRKLT